MEVSGLVKGISTKSKANKEGQVFHTTKLIIEVEDLAREVLDALALAEFEARGLRLELVPRRNYGLPGTP